MRRRVGPARTVIAAHIGRTRSVAPRRVCRTRSIAPARAVERGTNRPCFRHKRWCPCGPQRTTKKLSRPAPHGSCSQRVAVAPIQMPETSGPNCRASFRASYLANSHAVNCHASCLAEPHVVTATTDATEPMAALIRWARDTCSSPAAAVPRSCALSSLRLCRAGWRSRSHGC